MLSLSSLEDIFISSSFSKYTAIGNDLKRSIERSIKFGKNIDKLLRMEDSLNKTLKYLKQDYSPYFKEMNLSKVDSSIRLCVVLPDNRIRYSSQSSLIGQKIPENVYAYFTSLFQNKKDVGGKGKNYRKFKNHYYLGLPIYKSMKQEWVGSIVLILNTKQINSFMYKVLTDELRISGFILASVFVFLLVLFFIILPYLQTRIKLSPKKISASIILVLLCSQISFSLLNTNFFKEYYLEITREESIVLGNLLKEDLEPLLQKNIKLKSFYLMEKMLGKILSSSPILSNITILDPQMRPLYMADTTSVIDFNKSGKDPLIAIEESNKVKGTKYNLWFDLEQGVSGSDDLQATTKAGSISITISRKQLFSELMNIMLDSITILIISVLFLMELLGMLSQYFSKQIKKTTRIHFAVIRPAIFLYFFGQTISVSFLPLYMEQLYEPFLGLSKEMIMGLPICATMLFGAISPLIAGPWVDKRGWHEPLFTGFILTCFGFVYTFFAPNAVHLIISRAFVGFGYGLTFMAANGFVVNFTDDNSKTQGLTTLIAGCYAGYICGSSTGGMLADHIGYHSVFIIGAAIIALSIIYTLVFMKNAMNARGIKVKPNPEKAQGSFKSLLQFMTDGKVIALCLFIILPSSMVTVGFINYFIPIYIDSIGSTPSNIGRLLMVHGLFFIYIAPFFSKYIDRSLQKSKFILLSAVLCSLSLTLFPSVGGLPAAVISILLLGLAGSFEAVIPFALGFKSTKKLGEAKAIAIFSSIEKIGQVGGPLFFGWLVLGANDPGNLYAMGVTYLLIALIFLLVNRREPA